MPPGNTWRVGWGRELALLGVARLSTRTFTIVESDQTATKMATSALGSFLKEGYLAWHGSAPGWEGVAPLSMQTLVIFGSVLSAATRDDRNGGFGGVFPGCKKVVAAATGRGLLLVMAWYWGEFGDGAVPPWLLVAVGHLKCFNVSRLRLIC